jgi:putative flippase GtrA
MSMIRYALNYLVEHRTQIAKFISVGFLTFGINFSTFHVFFGVCNWNYRLAVSLAYIITVVSHFSLNRIFTFNANQQPFVHNLRRYLYMIAINYAITLSIMGLVVDLAGLSPYLGVVASTAATASSSFFLMKYFVFKGDRACQS